METDRIRKEQKRLALIPLIERTKSRKFNQTKSLSWVYRLIMLKSVRITTANIQITDQVIDQLEEGLIGILISRPLTVVIKVNSSRKITRYVSTKDEFTLATCPTSSKENQLRHLSMNQLTKWSQARSLYCIQIKRISHRPTYIRVP